MANAQDQYEVVRPIGSGSFGQVYLVLHTAEQRYYVMKEVASFATMDVKQRESTEQEVNLLHALRHPNIVGYRDSIVNDAGHLAIYMEYCEQGDMYLYLQDAKKTGKMPGEVRLLEWFVQIVLALQALHIRKILHRDLKTQNIFLTGSRVQHAFALKLGDLGVAKVLSSTCDLAMTQIGTPFYMSPELFNNKPYGYKSDVWGLGCVLYEVINGQRPFDAQSINGLAFKVMQGRYMPVTSSCTEETKLLIKSLLSTNSAHRPTLQEILHTPTIRRRIKTAIQMVNSAALPEARAQSESTLTEQLVSLGLGKLVNCHIGAEPRRDRRQLLQRLERAERRRKREEETLRRLQETAALLAQCLMDTSPQSQNPAISHLNLLTARPHELDVSDEIEFVPQPANDYNCPQWHSGAPVHAAADRGLPNSARGEAPEPSGENFTSEDPYPPAMSHRDRILLRKERRREEEQQKFEEEARKIREENLAYQRAWVQDSHRSRAPTKEQHMASNSQHHHNHHVLPQLALGVSNAHAMPSSALPGHSHMPPDNLARPFQSIHPNVVNSPRQSRFHSEPKPPKPQFGHPEPQPPLEAVPHASGRWSSLHYGQYNSGLHSQTSRSLHSVCLDSLSSDGLGKLPDHSEDSGFEGSANHSDDGLSDVGTKPYASNEQVHRHSQVVQQQIDACRAAIYRHKMTIETLQYSCAQDGHDAPEQFAVLTSSSFSSELLPPPRESQLPCQDSGVYSQDTRYRSSGAPPIVLDRIARLKRRCMEGLGSERFQSARQCLQTLLDAGEVAEAVRTQMLAQLGLEKIGFYSLIDQIVYMECRWSHTEAVPQELA
jgi:NIMA (never in mitosis gene a)-related kinase